MSVKTYIFIAVVLAMSIIWMLNRPALPENWQILLEKIDARSDKMLFLKELCTRIGGRISGSENGHRAEDFLIGQLQKAGFTEILTDTFSHPGWERISCRFQLTNPPTQEIPAIAMGYTVDSSNLAAAIVDLGFGYDEDFSETGKTKIENKIVLIDLSSKPGARDMHRTERVRLAEKYGAAGAVLVNSNEGSLLMAGIAAFKNYCKIPVIGLTREEGMQIKRVLHKNNEVKAAMKILNKTYRAQARNIYVDLRSEIEGASTILLSAHLDSWDLGQGAVDNGMNIAMVFEIARILKSIDFPLQKNIRFVWFMGEEFGMHGSFAYTRDHLDELSQISFFINLDMTFQPYCFNLMLNGHYQDYFEILASKLSRFGLQKQVVSKPWLNSDHVPFMLENVPLLTFECKLTPAMIQTYHSKDDSLKIVDEPGFEKTLEIIALTLIDIADERDIKPVRMSESEIEEKLIKYNLKYALELQDLWPIN